MRTPNSTLQLAPAFVLTATFLLCGCGGEGEPAPADTASPPSTNSTADATGTAGGTPTAEPSNANASGASSPGSVFDTPASSSEIDQAREVLRDVGRTYREAPTLMDELALSSPGTTPQSLHVRFGQDNRRIEMRLPTRSATYIDGTLYVANDFMFDVYLAVEDVEDPAIGIIEHAGFVPSYHFAMRSSEGLSDEAAVDSYIAGLGLGILQNARVRGYSQFTDDEGNEFHRIAISSPNGEGQVLIDAQTMLIKQMELQIFPAQGQPANIRPTLMRVQANPVLADKLEEPIEFDASDRERVTDAAELVSRPLRPGDRAPNLRFTTSEGEVIRLADLRGYVVVIDFWATWCVPCIQGLPNLDRFTKWAEEEGQPVKVFAVNTKEQHETAEERREAVERFWNEREFVTPLVYDDENSRSVLRTGYGNIPLLFVIDTEGRITRVKNQYDRNTYQILKAEVGRALAPADDEAEE